MPLQRRIPKRGFTNINRVEYQAVNVRDLGRIDAGEVTPEILHAHGLIGTLRKPVKILGTGEIDGAYQISAHGFSKAAVSKIEGAGGTVTVIGAAEEPSAEAAVEAAVEAAGEPAVEAAGEPAVEEVTESEEASAPEGDEASEAEDEQA
jgi:hypothetical protein